VTRLIDGVFHPQAAYCFFLIALAKQGEDLCSSVRNLTKGQLFIQRLLRLASSIMGISVRCLIKEIPEKLIGIGE
jgi:hypothetical protein